METTIQVMGRKTRQLRRDNRLTLEEASDRAGCTPGFLSQVERNQAVPSISMLNSITHALGVEVTHLDPKMAPDTKAVQGGACSEPQAAALFALTASASSSTPPKEAVSSARSRRENRLAALWAPDS